MRSKWEDEQWSWSDLLTRVWTRWDVLIQKEHQISIRLSIFPVSRSTCTKHTDTHNTRHVDEICRRSGSLNLISFSSPQTADIGDSILATVCRSFYKIIWPKCQQPVTYLHIVQRWPTTIDCFSIKQQLCTNFRYSTSTITVVSLDALII